MKPKIWNGIFLLFTFSFASTHVHQIGVLLHGSGLTSFPDGSYESIKVVNFLNNDISELKPYVFASHRFYSLEKAIMRDNNIKLIHANAFEKMSKLTQLDLHGNHLVSFKKGAFEGLDLLETLRLGTNSISSIEAEVLAPLKSLETLDLSHNSIKNLKRTFLKATAIVELNLSGNDLVLEPGGVLESTHLTQLDLQSCSLKELPKDAFNLLPMLETLDLSRNQLSVLPESLFKENIHLKYLDISFNSLTSLDVKVFHVPTNLDVLHCNGNPLQDGFDCAQLLVTMHNAEQEVKAIVPNENEVVIQVKEKEDEEGSGKLNNKEEGIDVDDQETVEDRRIEKQNEESDAGRPVDEEDSESESTEEEQSVETIFKVKKRMLIPVAKVTDENKNEDDTVDNTKVESALIFTIIAVSAICLILVIVLLGEIYYLL